MKTGLGIYKKYRMLYAYYNYYKFLLKKTLLGFDVANQFIQRIDKNSVQLVLRKTRAIIGANCNIESGIIFHNCHDYSNLIIGNNCHIGKDCLFDLRNKIIIGDNVVISMRCTFLTHIDLTKSSLSVKYPSSSKEICISNNCYIGACSTILMNVEIGESAFIAAGALVNKSVPPYTKVGGVPAREIP
jgi:acetyltransferase-like isoleucine patch superfamily enzyme